jgi:hypothetical protein
MEMKFLPGAASVNNNITRQLWRSLQRPQANSAARIQMYVCVSFCSRPRSLAHTLLRNIHIQAHKLSGWGSKQRRKIILWRAGATKFTQCCEISLILTYYLQLRAGDKMLIGRRLGSDPQILLVAALFNENLYFPS